MDEIRCAILFDVSYSDRADPSIALKIYRKSWLQVFFEVKSQLLVSFHEAFFDYDSFIQ